MSSSPMVVSEIWSRSVPKHNNMARDTGRVPGDARSDAVGSPGWKLRGDRLRDPISSDRYDWDCCDSDVQDDWLGRFGERMSGSAEGVTVGTG